MNKQFLQSQRHISKSITIVLLFFQFSLLNAQEKLSMTFEDALDLAKQNSPEIRQARYALERSQELLNAQEASLKSRFGLSLEPFFYNHQSEFNTLFSTWNTIETKSYSGTLSIMQPIIWTDGTISLNNQFGWLDSKSDFIDSVMRGIVPNNLIFNNDIDKEHEVCIDGKQRITSLIEFKQNKISVQIEEDIVYFVILGLNICYMIPDFLEDG